jgi:glycine/D-amino acid oxidase-like deaminating enzyme
MKTRYGRSPWVDRVPRSGVPSYPSHRGHLDTSIVVVGGGLTGCATAYAFAASGIRVVLLEAERVGRSGTGAAAGWIGPEPGAAFDDVAGALGLRTARGAWQAWRRAALDFAALVRRLGLRCGLQPFDTALVALTEEQSTRLAHERKARRAAGLDTPSISVRSLKPELGLEALAGIRVRDGAAVDPYRACLGLLRAAVARGASVFERSAVMKIAFGRKDVQVQTRTGTIRATRVVVATGGPTPLFDSLARHARVMNTYHVLTEPMPASIRNQVGRRLAVIRDGSCPSHLARWVGDDRVLVTGADADVPPSRSRDRVIVQRTGQLMYELSTLYPAISGVLPAYGWDETYTATALGLPFIGPHRNYPHHLFAFGDASHGITGAYLASRILLRQHLSERNAADDAFSFTR